MNNKVNGIRVSGEGVAIGTGNTVIVQNNRITNHHNNGNGKGPEQQHKLLKYRAAALAVLIVAAYCFAKYVNYFFAVAFTIGSIEAILPLTSLAIQFFYKHPIEHPWQESSSFTLSAALAFLINNIWQNYPEKIQEFASQTTSSHAFWCSLSTYGETIAAQYLFAAIGLVIAILLLLPHSLRAISQFLFDAIILY